MEAEQKAADIIQSARLLKKQRKAQADEDALAEINAYRALKEGEFAQIVKVNEGGSDDTLGKLVAEADSACNVLKTEFEQNKDKAADMLCKYVSSGLL